MTFTDMKTKQNHPIFQRLSHVVQRTKVVIPLIGPACLQLCVCSRTAMTFPAVELIRGWCLIADVKRIKMGWTLQI